MGVLGWSKTDFESSSPSDVLHALSWRKRHTDNLEETIWEAARMLGFWLLQPYTKRGDLKKPSDLIVYPWNEQEKKQPKVLTEEEEAARQARLARWDAEMRQKYGK